MISIMNKVDTISIAELLDGRTFVIPSYQRGYRWSEKQVGELLDDLYSFALRREEKDKGFYCLQPIIVRQLTEEEINDVPYIPTKTKGVWEVVDGQQRLTTIYILLKFLIKALCRNEEDFKDNYSSKNCDGELYKIIYETRVDDTEFLHNVGDNDCELTNIDADHANKAYIRIEKWVNEDAKQIGDRFNGTDSRKKVILEKLLKLLTTPKKVISDTGSAQFIWYELDNDEKANPIDEFLKINNGKISLTDAELVKALFLQKQNFVNGNEKDTKQIEMSMQWENIENTLHKDDFWHFIHRDKMEAANRIELLLTLVYQSENKWNMPKEEGDLFRFYNSKLEGTVGESRTQIVKDLWSKIVHCFYILEDWYEDPVLYNYIGLLSHYGISLNKIFNLYATLPEDSTTDDFISGIRKMINDEFICRIKIDDGRIDLEYKQNKAVRKLLLFLNIEQLNKQMQRLRSSQDQTNRFYVSPAYKFPFDIYVSQEWDVEHIDSATANALKSDEEKRSWIRDAEQDLQMEQSDTQGWDSTHLSSKIEELQRNEANEDKNREDKDWIGNLTLLDKGTNRSYGNSLFTKKRKIISEKIKSGVYVPLCTQWVFNKTFVEHPSYMTWNDDDKKAYNNFMLDEINEFIKK